MPASIKRAISPPSLKRRKIEAPQPIHLAPSIAPRPFTDLAPNQFRIYSWNVNGIKPFLQTSIESFFRKRKRTPLTDEENTSPSLITCLARWKYPQVVGLQELQIRRGDTQTLAAIQKSVRPRYKVHFSLPKDKHNVRSASYGVAMLVREDIEADAIAPSWDLEGRVLLLKLEKPRIAIFNVYFVNGTDNPYRDPQTCQVIGVRHDKKKLFHTDLQKATRELEFQGWAVFIAGDVNIARQTIDGFPKQRSGKAHAENRADFEAKFMKGDLDMVDTFRHLHGDERKYSYRSPGLTWGSSCDRIDLILASRIAADAVVEADILDTVLERGPSDHCPVYATIDLNKIRSSSLVDEDLLKQSKDLDNFELEGSGVGKPVIENE